MIKLIEICFYLENKEIKTVFRCETVALFESLEKVEAMLQIPYAFISQTISNPIEIKLVLPLIAKEMNLKENYVEEKILHIWQSYYEQLYRLYVLVEDKKYPVNPEFTLKNVHEEEYYCL